MASHNSLKSEEYDAPQDVRKKRRYRGRPTKIIRTPRQRKPVIKKRNIIRCKQHHPIPKPKRAEETTKGKKQKEAKEKCEQNKMTAEEARKIWQAFRDSEERITNETSRKFI